MERNRTATAARPNDHETYDEAENMDRAAQSGSEGAFDEDTPNRNLADLRRDAEAAFGGTDVAGSPE